MGQVRIILEFCDLGNLRDALDQGILKGKNGKPDYAAVLDTAVEIASGMVHLHASNIVHADLKVGGDRFATLIHVLSHICPDPLTPFLLSGSECAVEESHERWAGDDGQDS